LLLDTSPAANALLSESQEDESEVDEKPNVAGRLVKKVESDEASLFHIQIILLTNNYAFSLVSMKLTQTRNQRNPNSSSVQCLSRSKKFKISCLNPTSNSLFRRGRVTVLEKESIAEDTEEALRKKELEAEERRKQSHDLVAESIRRELAESALAMLFYQLLPLTLVP
jgi:hypothetical protein